MASAYIATTPQRLVFHRAVILILFSLPFWLSAQTILPPVWASNFDDLEETTEMVDLEHLSQSAGKTPLSIEFLENGEYIVNEQRIRNREMLRQYLDELWKKSPVWAGPLVIRGDKNAPAGELSFVLNLLAELARRER
ncbi:MAG: hypothetical protein EAZ89_13070 [Bacteroidetes bacterium]|nr:MAG: hypothetical protein EAZ89_13070 [Bacteroidota bacterium]